MVDLKTLQEQFLKSVVTDEFSKEIEDSMIPGGTLSKLNCLGAYRNDYTARLTSTLGDNFESLWTILGDEEFFELCSKYIKENPSTLYDLGGYGSKLPVFLKDHETSYLSDLATLEIEYRRLFNSAFVAGLSAESFSKMGDPSNICFELSPLLFYSHSKFPLYRIWENRGNNSEESFEAITWEPENFVMYNLSGIVQVKFLSEFQSKIFAGLQSGKSLGDAIEVSGEGQAPEVSDLFSFLVSCGLITSFK